MMNETAGMPGGRLLATISRACLNLGILLLAMMSILIVAQVLGRNLFDLGMPWADELSRFCGVALVFLGVPLLALRGSHVAVDMVPTMLPPAGRRACALIVEIMVLAFGAISVWSIYAFLSRAWKFATPTLGIPNWVYYTPAAIALALLTIITVSRIAALLRGAHLSHDEPGVSPS
ncbi:TRAP transporter small permease [Shinella fusca]|uniref:TRAP transporter small permease protein n=1 Tax=Shinella fusca TaxID=544480 RepID=A0A7W7YZ10_9HYPH|nr:TRAP transporter small permease [Shinella fusca]MBB5044908.1 TRAP-type C4-dicarboxylate transport system permease small subunit [Shinella fusca]